MKETTVNLQQANREEKEEKEEEWSRDKISHLVVLF